MEKLQKAAPFIALLALVLGVTGLALGFIAFQRTQNGDEVTALKDNISTLSENLTAVQAKLSSQKSDFVTKDDLRSIANQTQDAFGKVSEQLSKIRTQSRGDTIKLAELEAKVDDLQQAGPTRVRPVVVSDDTSAQTTPNENGTFTYKIQSGDTLGKVAKEFGISLDTLLTANPGIQPRRLQLGQEILIPAQ